VGDIVDSELPAVSGWKMSFWRYSIQLGSGEFGPYLRNAQFSEDSRWCFRWYSLLLDLSLKDICLKVS
jgi:hypothetical protein